MHLVYNSHCFQFLLQGITVIPREIEGTGYGGSKQCALMIYAKMVNLPNYSCKFHDIQYTYSYKWNIPHFEIAN